MSKAIRPPECLDQPFLIYNAVSQKRYDNQFMNTVMENNPTEVDSTKIIYHFPGSPGRGEPKLIKMFEFWGKMTGALFDTRNDMMKAYCDKVSNPRILEIGVFRGEFLNFMAKQCNHQSIDAVDLFDGVTCSGDVNGNDVVYYDVGKSYFELLDKYVHRPNIRIIKANSVEFLKSRSDNSYDIIYIDGDHSYEGVKKDIVEAFRKVKNGGYIMGHDYEMNMKKAKTAYNFGVKQAVDEFCAEYGQTIAAKAMDGCVSYCIHITK